MDTADHSLMGTIKSALVPIHRAGWPFVAIFAVASAILGLLWQPLGWIGLVLGETTPTPTVDGLFSQIWAVSGIEWTPRL